MSTIGFETFSCSFSKKNSFQKRIKRLGSKTQKSYLICFWWSLFFPCRTHVPLDFPGQIVKSPQVLSHLLLVVAIFPCRTHVPLDFSGRIVKSPQVLSHLLLVVAIFPLPHPCAIRFPRSNRQIPTSPISFAFSGRHFLPCRTHVPLDFSGRIVKSP